MEIKESLETPSMPNPRKLRADQCCNSIRDKEPSQTGDEVLGKFLLKPI